MKKIFLILTTLVVSYTHAQDITDALRYAQSNSGGSARYRAMGGAFGALGGDLSSMKVNPAGSVIFANNQIGFTLSNSNDLTDSHYFGTKSSDSKSSLNIGQLGAVFVFQNNHRNDSNWKKFAVSANYENSRDFNSSVNIVGTNPYSSIDSYFLNNSYGVSFERLNNISYQNLYYYEQQAYLGYNSYILDYDSTNQEFYTNVAPGGNYHQANRVKSYGYNGKLSFNFSGQYTDKFSFGINLNSHFADFRQVSQFTESNENPKYPSFSTVDHITFNNELQTYGSGFSLQLGTIYKPIKQLRLGLAYESPTWYKLTDDVTQSVITSGYGLNDDQNSNIYNTDVVTNPDLTATLAPYKLQTPSKWTGSLAYVFGKRGLISLDLSAKNYNGTNFKPKTDFYYQNRDMANLLNNTSTELLNIGSLKLSYNKINEVRLGAEYKIKKVSLRGGYHWEQSPYKNHINMGDLTTYSGGLGYNFGSIKLDMAYSHGKTYYNQQMFSQGLTDTAKINTINHSITASLLFEL